MTANTDKPARSTLIAFILLVLVGGGNVVAVRFSNLSLPPFWGAAARFAIAALIFWAIILIWRISLPRGRALGGALLYGALSIGGSYAFLYWAILYVRPSVVSEILALGPLITFFFAWLHGLEPFRWRGLFGALIAFIGILFGVGQELGSNLPAIPLLVLILGVACIAEGSVVFKLFPKGHPLATNALALSIGSLILVVVSLIAGERWGVPTTSSTWVAFIYLVLIGSLGLFYLYLYVLDHWTATATSYAFLLFPVATIIISSWLLNEMVTPRFILGVVLVLFGVWVGAIAPSRKSATSKP